MTAVEYLRAIRRRWSVVVAAVIVAVAAAWVVMPGQAAPQPGTDLYEARVTLLSTVTGGVTGTDPSTPDITNLATIAALVTLGDVPERVAEATGATDPAQLASNVAAEADADLGFVNIVARQETAGDASRLAQAFARELQGYLEDRVLARIEAERASLDRQIGAVEEEVERLDRRIAGASSAERNALSSRRSATAQSLQQLVDRRQGLTGIQPDSGLEIVARSAPERVSDAALQAPQGRGLQLVAAGVVGLVLGLVLALIIERFDVRIRDKRGVEAHFDLPVLAEIPALPRKLRGPIVATAPRSHEANAFRLLASATRRDRVGSDSAPAEARNGSGGAGETILVTSAGPREGKSTVVANLAAAFAEAHRKVTVLSCDFRRPSIHRLLGVPNDHGLAEGLAAESGPVLNGQVHTTAIPDLRVVPSGSAVDRPGELLSSPRMAQALAEAKKMSDVVLLDCGPIFTAGESAHLLRQVDTVVLVARAGKTSPVVAERTSELLRRLAAPVAGVALTFAREPGLGKDRWYTR